MRLAYYLGVKLALSVLAYGLLLEPSLLLFISRYISLILLLRFNGVGVDLIKWRI